MGSSLEEQVLDVADMMEKRSSVQPALVAKSLRKAVAETKWGVLNDMQRGVVFGVCAMTPSLGSWGELPEEAKEAIGIHLRSWLPLIGSHAFAMPGATSKQLVLAR